MPYASKAQAGFFHANKKKLEAQGVDVAEWDKSSKGKKLPDKVKKEAAAMLKEILARNTKTAELDTPDKKPGDTALASGKIPEEGREISDKKVKKPTGEDKMKPPGPTKPPEGMKDDGLKVAKFLAKAAAEGAFTQPELDKAVTRHAGYAFDGAMKKDPNYLNKFTEPSQNTPGGSTLDLTKIPELNKPPAARVAPGMAPQVKKTGQDMTPEQREYVLSGNKSVKPMTAPAAPAAPVTAPAPKAVAPPAAPIKPTTGMNSTQNANDYVLFGGKKLAAAPGHLLAAVLIRNLGV